MALAPFQQKPSLPIQPQPSVHSATALTAAWFAPESDGGDTIIKYKIEWDPSPTFDSGSSGLSLGSDDVPVIGACAETPCKQTISALTKGTPYFVRSYSYNSYGFSAVAAKTVPEAETPCTQPMPPSSVTVSTGEDATGLLVSFPHSSDDGGMPVTKYLVEWDLAHEQSALQGGTSANILYAKGEAVDYYFSNCR